MIKEKKVIQTKRELIFESKKGSKQASNKYLVQVYEPQSTHRRKSLDVHLTRARILSTPSLL